MGDRKCREVKTAFCRKGQMQTGSSGTLIGWKSGKTMHFCPSMGLNRGNLAMDSVCHEEGGRGCKQEAVLRNNEPRNSTELRLE
jgi:hypothetical protein